jgi:hypothetical protein
MIFHRPKRVIYASKPLSRVSTRDSLYNTPYSLLDTCNLTEATNNAMSKTIRVLFIKYQTLLSLSLPRHPRAISFS